MTDDHQFQIGDTVLYLPERIVTRISGYIWWTTERMMRNIDILPKSITLVYSCEQGQPLLCKLTDNSTGNVFSVLSLEKAASFLETFKYKWLTGSNGIWGITT